MEARVLDICGRVMTEVNDGVKKHGAWDDYDLYEMQAATTGELLELDDALRRSDLTGQHGMIREAIQAAGCLVKMVVQIESRLKFFCEDGHEWFGECLPAVCPRCKRPALGVRRVEG